MVWAYIYRDRTPADIEQLTADLRAGGIDMSRLTISVGVWATYEVTPPEAIAPETLQAAVEAAATNGITDVNVTPLSLMDDERWAALGWVWSGSS